MNEMAMCDIILAKEKYPAQAKWAVGTCWNNVALIFKYFLVNSNIRGTIPRGTMYLDVCNIENFEKVGQSLMRITQCFLYIPLKLDENKSTLFLIHKSWLCRCTQVCPTFLFKTIIVCCAFPVLPVEKTSFINQATLVLTNNFLKLNSFSRTIHILISAASLANLLDLPENLATDFFRKKSIAFFDFWK